MKMLALAGAFLCLAPVGFACASDTTTYTYDTAGRLVSAAIQGGPNSGVTTNIVLDSAGNRIRYGVATSGGCQIAASDAQAADESTIYISVQALTPCSGPVTLSYSSGGGTAGSGSYYTGGSGSITLQSSTALVTIYPIRGSIPAGETRTFYVNFTVQGGAATLTDAQSFVTIVSTL